MVEIIQEFKKPTRMQQIGQLLGGLGNVAGNVAEARMQHQQQQSMGQKLQELTGMDIGGLPPELQKVALAEALKSQGKQQVMGQKQDFLGQLFGQRGQQNQNRGQQLQGQSQEMQQQGGFDASQLSDADIAEATSMDPNLGRVLQHSRDVALREARENKRLDITREKMSPEFQRQQHIESSQAQADVKYNQELQSAAKQHELKTQTLNKLEALNKKGVTGKPYEKLLEKFGLVNLTSEGRREFAADVKNLITDIRSILGGQFSQFEFQTILNAYPSADFSKDANSAIIKNLQEFQGIRNREFELAKEIKKENKGKLPLDFQSQVNDRLNEYAQSRLPEIKANTQRIMTEEYGIPAGNVLMFDPQGEPLNVSPQDVDRYIQAGASLP
jgi:hypothetical protein